MKTLHMELTLTTLSIAALLLTLPDQALAQGLELKPLSDMANSYQTAGICFLPDCEDKLLAYDGNANVDSRWCEDEGYNYFASGHCPQYNYEDICPRGNNYLKCNPTKWCTENGYTVTSCAVPEYLDEQCPNNLAYYKRCKTDYKKACQNENPNFVDRCQNGWQLDSGHLCTYSPTFGTCCNKCEGFDYTAADIPLGYLTGERCDGCNGTRYKKIINPCSGFTDCPTYGPSVGAATCWSGNVKKYSSCKIGCDTGYIDWCTNPVTDCAALGYSKTASNCTGQLILKCPYDTSKVMCW